MSIATAIQNAQQKVAAAYTAVSSKGGTLPQTQDLSNLPTAINSISGGGSSTKYNITIDDLLGNIDENGVYHEPTTQANVIFTGIKSFADDYCMMYEFARHPDIRSVSFPDLEDINKRSCLDYAFIGCTNLTSVSFPKLSNMSSSFYGLQGTFNNCTSLTSLNLSLLTRVTDHGLNSICQHCSNLTSINLDSVKTILPNGLEYAFRYTKLSNVILPALEEVYSESLEVAFADIPTLTSASFPALKKIDGYNACQNTFLNSSLTSMTFPSLSIIRGRTAMSYCFQNCSLLKDISFPALTSTFNIPTSGTTYTNIFDNMLPGVTDCTVHFPSNLESVIGSWTSVTNGFGGTNTTVLFDLPATE